MSPSPAMRRGEESLVAPLKGRIAELEAENRGFFMRMSAAEDKVKAYEQKIAEAPCWFADAEVLGAEATADYCYMHQNFCEPKKAEAELERRR